MRSLMERLKRGELTYARVVIETTGIAAPGPIMHTLVVDDLIAPHFRLDGVVTAADAATGLDMLSKHAEAVGQIAMADLIIVTKTDLVSEEDVSRFEDHIEGINTAAPRISADHGGTHDHHHHHDHHKHGQIVSGSIELWEPIPSSVFDFWLDMLIALKGADILRMKGIVHVEGMEQPFVFHGVQHIFDLPVPLKSWTGTDTRSRVVLIARNMTKEDLQTSLDMLRMQPKDVEVTSAEAVAEPVEMPF